MAVYPRRGFIESRTKYGIRFTRENCREFRLRAHIRSRGRGRNYWSEEWIHDRGFEHYAFENYGQSSDSSSSTRAPENCQLYSARIFSPFANPVRDDSSVSLSKISKKEIIAFLFPFTTTRLWDETIGKFSKKKVNTIERNPFVTLSIYPSRKSKNAPSEGKFIRYQHNRNSAVTRARCNPIGWKSGTNSGIANASNY